MPGVLTLAFLFAVTRLTLLFLLAPWEEERRQVFMRGDAEYYYCAAANLADGRGYSAMRQPPFEPDARRPPAYPLVLASVMAVTGKEITALLIVNLVLQGLTIGLIAWGLRQITPTRPAFWLTLYCLLDPVFLFLGAALYSESLYQVFNVTAFYLALRFVSGRANDAKSAAMLGMVWGANVLTRPLGLFFGFFISVFLLLSGDRRRGARNALLFALVAAAVVSPWLLRNRLVFGHVAMTSMDGDSLLRFYVLPFLDRYGYESEARDARSAMFVALDEEDPFQRSRRLRSLAISGILEHPLQYAGYHFSSTLPTLFGAGLKEVPAVVAPRYRQLAGGSYSAAFLVRGLNGLALVALYALYVLGLIRCARSRKLGVAAFLGLGVFYYLLLTGPNASSRYRLSYLPFLLASSAIALETHSPAAKIRRRLQAQVTTARSQPRIPDALDSPRVGPRCPCCSNPGSGLFKTGEVAPPLTPGDLLVSDRSYGRTLALFRCPFCEFVFADPKHCRGIGVLYGELVDPGYRRTLAARLRQANWLLAQALERLPSARTLLDVGAGFGALTSTAKQKGLNAIGVEPCQSFRKAAAEDLGVELLPGLFPEVDLGDRRFDLIFLVDVLEHVEKPVEVLRKCRQHLARGSLICIVTPNLGSLVPRVLGRRWWHFRAAHIGYFNLASLEEAAKRAGLRLQEHRTSRWYFQTRYLASRIQTYLPRAGKALSALGNRYNAVVPLDLGDSLLIFLSDLE